MPFSMVANLAGIPLQEANICLMWLRSQQYVTCIKGEHLATTKGEEYYRETLVKQSQVDSNKFKEEALSGMTQRKSAASGFMISEQSEIENAVLSTCKMPVDRGPTPEENVAAMWERARAVKFICENLGLSRQLYAKLSEDGRIRVCSGHNGTKHIGVFDKNGDRWQHLCRECTKARKK